MLLGPSVGVLEVPLAKIGRLLKAKEQEKEKSVEVPIACLLFFKSGF